MHRATLALAVAGALAVQLGHHTFEVRPLGNTVAVAAVGADDLIVALEVGADAGRHRFLSDVAVDDAIDSAGLKVVRGALLKTADGLHGAQQLQLCVWRHRVPPVCSLIFQNSGEYKAFAPEIDSLSAGVGRWQRKGGDMMKTHALSTVCAADEIGALNMITAATSLAVLQRINSGKIYDLSVDNFVGMPGLADLGMGDPPFHMWMTHTPNGVKVEGLSPAGSPDQLALYDDAIIMSTHTGTHLDALNHLGYGDKIFNGFDNTTYLSDKGWTKAGADKIPPIIARGILIDVAAEKGLDILPDSYEISSDDLQRAMTRQGIALQDQGLARSQTVCAQRARHHPRKRRLAGR